MPCLYEKLFKWLVNGTVLGQSSPNISGGKICKIIIYGDQIISHVEDIITLSKGQS